MGKKPKPKACRSQVQQLVEARKKASERLVEQGSKNQVPPEETIDDAKRLRLLSWQQMVATARGSKDRHYSGKQRVQLQNGVGSFAHNSRQRRT